MLTPQQISEKLETLPAKIAKASEDAIEKWRLFQIAEENLRTKKAKRLLDFKAEFKDAPQGILAARVDIDTENDRLNLIEKEAEFRSTEKEVKRFDNEFTGTKRIGELLKTELMSIEGTIRRNDL